MKALYERLKQLEQLTTHTEFNMAVKLGRIDELKNAIAELEELENKSCENCKQKCDEYCWEHDCDCKHMGNMCGKWEKKNE